MKGLHTYKHIIWDWNGTLLDDCWLCLDIMNELLRKRDRASITHETYQAIFGFPIIDYYKKVGFNFVQEPFESVAIEFIEIYHARSGECTLQPDAREVLDACLDLGLRQSVLSAMEQSYLSQMVRALDLENYFETLIGLNDHYASGKTENGRTHLRKLGIAAKDVLFIGDTLHDFEVASVMGTDCILVANGHHSRERLSTTGATVLNSLREILPKNEHVFSNR